MSDAADNAAPYQSRSAVQYASKVALQAGTVGIVLSAVQNALDKHNRGAMGVLTRTGGTIGFFAAMGGTFAFTETYVANQRQKNDALNGAAGGCAAGFLAGVRSRSIPMALAGCALLGASIGGYDYAGQLAGDSSETKEERRKRFFKTPPAPLVETTSTD
ncbi:hypothetical protein BDN70DRAFT_992244 [Pholiota conissans]|uniref:NADH dehydrogenase [ubiquinone] 1 alpha subcomplex subunit 11 n=1 Tax=Pholiota conissans TaxID=109636 RepID=A0A9P5Z530_9AGAR|nr:hypothetical protein BDN70DRAFT_992244 [Pholiota conissans]